MGGGGGLLIPDVLKGDFQSFLRKGGWGGGGGTPNARYAVRGFSESSEIRPKVYYEWWFNYHRPVPNLREGKLIPETVIDKS